MNVQDLRRQIDWLREAWNTDDEWQIAKRLTRIKAMLRELPEPHCATALEIYAELCKARLTTTVDWQAAITRLQLAVSAWNRSRPAVVKCGYEYQPGVECRIPFRSEVARREHLETAHGRSTP